MKTHVYKLVLGLLLTLLIGINLNAQEYEYIPLVKPGIQIWTTTAATEGYRHYNRFALTEEDTLMEGLSYKKLYWFTDSVFNPLTSECIGGLRENEQKQVFYKGSAGYDNEDWRNGMLFDFSLSVGDTFYFQSAGIMEFIVGYIDTVEIGGIPRKQFYLVDYFSHNFVCKIIEGIGNEFGLLFDIVTSLQLKAHTTGELLCYEHDGDLQYMSEYVTNCSNPFAGLNDIIEEDNSITLYPNPTRKEVNISSESIINSIEVFNSLGQKVYQTNVKAKGKTLDINSLSKGVYIIGVNTDKGYSRKKLVKD